MALINCKECEKQVSNQAESCPNCGVPLVITNEESNTITNKHLTPIQSLVCFIVMLVVLFFAFQAMIKFDQYSAQQEAHEKREKREAEKQRAAARAERISQLQAEVGATLTIESDSRIDSDLNSRVITDAVSLIRNSGYKCKSLSAIIGGGSYNIRVSCNHYRFIYDLEDKGAGWFVTAR